MGHAGKYLEHYAERETRLLSDFPRFHWDYCLLIPAFAETPDFYDRLRAGVVGTHRVLLVLVINQPDSASPDSPSSGSPLSGREQEIHPLNRLLMAHVLGSGELRWRSGPLSLVDLPCSGSGVLIVDRFSEHPLPARQGVGLARKIAADLALGLIMGKQIASPWLFCTDADSLLPANYFDAVASAGGAAACTYHFSHLCDATDVGNATRCYEISLHHYVNGLKLAASPYAFHTVGSTIAVNSAHYAMVRGFPKRAGGEDFYLLNKLAKTGQVVALEQPVVGITPRISTRVPFGTGPAVERILAMENPGADFMLYNPRIFEELKQWLAIVPHLMDSDQPLQALSRESRQSLLALGVEEALRHSRRQGKTLAGFVKHMNIWFDGFRTLKYVHYLQNHGFSPVAIGQLYGDILAG